MTDVERGRTAQDEHGDAVPRPPTANQGPDELGALPKRSYLAVLKRTVKEFGDDNVTVWAAALTYYGVLSIFPGLLLMVTALRLFGQDTVRSVVDNVSGIAPGSVADILGGAAENLQKGGEGTAGLLAVVSVLGALWSASGYIGVFMQASNAIYDVPEGRPIWKTLPIRLGVTLLTGVLLTAAALMVVFTGRLADQVGHALGIGSGAVTVWNIAKWPVLVLIVSLLFAILYWASPNAKHGGFRWVSPGGLVAVVLWLAASGGFALYVANFGSYNKTYGSLATVIIFLVWLWISNIAILLGAEFDAELQRSRAVQAGHPETEEPYVELRDTRKLDR
ncbi:YihY/virulence factor BrkB family protein [Dactylosporangium aurantiacum]|uniref:YihY/virulence factor BrkB family protein n=1 Tax=Dactylosporangium aurantiacum TaxID=35754 RepID=A0A9Q9I8V2_9ACTN|nr:YihY/virulence factor BrkB family protein [Dactylosporangium aurantiacum]MDG6103578.1 YihY/virulence factor BrkB family protein [Dactylosporangium aurantiacum]UWZ51929.1 YihY/virulence factor BrkB family protein [Dactylosporangium aurantiacum]